VEILELNLAPWGVAYNQPPCSPLSNAANWAEAREYFLVRVEQRDGEAVVSDRLRWPLSPMIETLACAPEWEVRSSGSGQGRGAGTSTSPTTGRAPP
jgi:hypothetical protein